jgi:hypothetical protein
MGTSITLTKITKYLVVGNTLKRLGLSFHLILSLGTMPIGFVFLPKMATLTPL